MCEGVDVSCMSEGVDVSRVKVWMCHEEGGKVP